MHPPSSFPMRLCSPGLPQHRLLEAQLHEHRYSHATLHRLSDLSDDLWPLANLDPDFPHVGAGDVQLHRYCTTFLAHCCRCGKFLRVEAEHTCNNRNARL